MIGRTLLLAAVLAVAPTSAAQEKKPSEELAELHVRELADLKTRVRSVLALVRMGEKAVPALARALASGDRNVREGAVVVLSTLGGRASGATGALIRALKFDDGRARVVTTILDMGTGTIPKLTEALGDKNPAVRAHAAAVLGRFGSKARSGIPALKRILDDQDEQVQRFAIAALRSIDPAAVPKPRTPSKKSTSYWLGQLDQEAVALRLRAVRALAVAGPEALPGLTRALKDRDPAVRLRSAEALGKFFIRLAAPLPGPPETLTSSSAPVKSGQKSRVQGVEAYLAGKGTKPPVRGINLDVRSKALEEIARFIGGRVGVPILVDTEVNEKVTVRMDELPWRDALKILAERVRCEVVATDAGTVRFIRISIEDVESGLTRALRDRDTKVRSASASALRAMGRRVAASIPDLIHALKDKESEVRTAAARAIGTICRRPKLDLPSGKDKTITLDVRDKSLVAVLNYVSTVVGVNIMVVEKDASEAKVTIQLDGVGWRTGLAAIARKAGYAVIPVNERLIRIVRPIPATEAIRALQNGLKDQEEQVRAAAKWALGEIRPPS